MYEKEIRLTYDNSHTPQPEASNTWWNGIYVAVLMKKPNITFNSDNFSTFDSRDI